jgi:hypothetical protein
VYLVNTLYENVDVAAALQQRLPKGLEPLAAPAAAALRQPAVNAVKLMLQRPRVQSLFVNASSVAHEKLVNVLENKTGHGISTGNGVVTINLVDLLKELAQEIGLSGDRISKIPADAATVTILKSDQLKTAQTGVRLVHVLSGWLLALVIAMYALAVYLAAGARRTTLRTIAWIFVAIGILLLVLRKVLGNWIVNTLSSTQYHDVTHRIWLIQTSILGDMGKALLFYGVVILIGMFLAGPTRPARRLRGWIAPVLNPHPWYGFGAAAGVWLLLILWGGTHALRTWWGILLVAALLALGTDALRRQTLEEYGPPSPEAKQAAVP